MYFPSGFYSVFMFIQLSISVNLYVESVFLQYIHFLNESVDFFRICMLISVISSHLLVVHSVNIVVILRYGCCLSRGGVGGYVFA